MSILPKEGGLQSSASMEGHEPPLILKTLQQGSLSMMDTSPEWPHPLRFRGNHSGGPEKQPGQAPWGTWSSGGAGTVPMQYWFLQHRTLLLSPVTSTAGYSFCFGSIPSFFLELFLH